MSGKHSGVQRRIDDEVKRDVRYIHCFNHQLHLIVVNICQNVDLVRDFFDVCQLLNDFFARPKVRTLYVKLGATTLARLMEHCWSGHFRTTKAVVENNADIVEALDYFATCAFPNLSVSGFGLKRSYYQARFIFTGLVMYQVLGALKPADGMFQSRVCSIANGYQVVNETIQLVRNMRTESKCSELTEECEL